MIKEKIYLSVIVPAYKAEKFIGNTLLDIDKYLSSQDYTYEILVVIDGGRDKTEHVVESYQKLVKNLRFINNKENLGKGHVVRQGMLEARGKYRLFMDADGSTSINHLDKMWPLVKKGYKVVIGTRDSKDAKGARQEVSQSFIKRLMGNFGNILIQIFGVWGIWDTQNGFKMFHEKAAKDIFSRVKMDRFSFDIEALALARNLGYKIGMIPVHWINDPHSTVTLFGPNGYVKVLLDLFIIRKNLIFDVYGISKKEKK